MSLSAPPVFSTTSLRILPAQSTHCDSINPKGLDVLVDKWAPTQNRRSLVALNSDDQVVGTCRGIDNLFHPQSRSLFLAVDPDLDFLSVAIPLVEKQKLVSTKPLHIKIPETNMNLLHIAKFFDAHFYQACPPYEYKVTPEIKHWANATLSHYPTFPPTNHDNAIQLEPITVENLNLALEIWVDGYIMQHKDWLATADKTVLIENFQPDYNPDNLALDIARSFLIMRNGTAIGAAQIWPDEPDTSELTISYLSTDYETTAHIFHLGIAAVLSRTDVNEIICIDSHWTLPHEFKIMSQLRQRWGTQDKDWTLLAAL